MVDWLEINESISVWGLQSKMEQFIDLDQNSNNDNGTCPRLYTRQKLADYDRKKITFNEVSRIK